VNHARPAWSSPGSHITEHRFFERVAKIYRSEHWGAMLHSVLSMWCECARQSGNVDATVPLLLEMIGLSEGVLHHTLRCHRHIFFAGSVSPEERTTLEEELTEILKVRHAVSSESRVVLLFRQSTSPSKSIHIEPSDTSSLRAPSFTCPPLSTQ
jgi:hypothetical protein